jgi:hypothetical protein
MALSSHISHLTRHLGQQIGRGGCSLREELDFNFSLFHQGPNGAVIKYFSLDPAPELKQPRCSRIQGEILTWLLSSQGTGGNIDPGLKPPRFQQGKLDQTWLQSMQWKLTEV